ncbi:MAG: TIGR01777 family oxidoreductase, partial [Chitinophagaceae bacterium]
MATILITGGTGMVGKHLTELLVLHGHNVIVLSRNKPVNVRSHAKVQYALWNIEQKTIDKNAIANADFIVHLAGAGVADKRWSVARKQEIVTSRINSSATICKALATLPNKVQAVISASAIGWYGADTIESKQHGFEENAPADTAFLGDTCRLWEESIAPVAGLGKRLAILRIGIVLSNSGGALAEFKKPVKMGVAAILGNGKQTISWIHVNDLCNMFLFAIEHQSVQGVFNAVAPKPVTNKLLTETLATIMKGKFYIPIYVPSFMLKIILGEMSIEVLKSATVSSKKIVLAGF